MGKVGEARPRPLIMYTYSSWSMRVQDTARSSFFVAAMCISFLARESQIMLHLVEPRPWKQLHADQDLKLALHYKSSAAKLLGDAAHVHACTTNSPCGSLRGQKAAESTFLDISVQPNAGCIPSCQWLHPGLHDFFAGILNTSSTSCSSPEAGRHAGKLARHDFKP